MLLGVVGTDSESRAPLLIASLASPATVRVQPVSAGRSSGSHVSPQVTCLPSVRQ